MADKHPVKIKREALKLTARKLADKAGVDKNTIYRIESGGARVRLETAAAIAKALTCEVSSIFQPEEITEGLGGTPIKKNQARRATSQPRKGVICKKCFIEIPVSKDTCPRCE